MYAIRSYYAERLRDHYATRDELPANRPGAGPRVGELAAIDDAMRNNFV